MSVYPKDNGYWFEFTFNGIRHRQSCKTQNEEVAKRIEAEHRRTLELGQVGLFDKKKQRLLFSTEVTKYVELMQPHWKPKTQEMHNTSLPKVLNFFGKMLLTSITATTIQQYQLHRSKQKTKLGTPPSNRTINVEITLVRQLLDHHKLWIKLREGSKLKMLKENKDTGRALSQDELTRLLQACRQSNSKALYTAVLLSVFTGLRSFELKALRWKQIDFLKATLTVGKSKSDAGENRVIDLTEQAQELITNWRSYFKALPEHFVFPSERYTSGGALYRTIPDQPYTTFWTSWNTARKAAEVQCRWHDLRHSCASVIGAGGASRATLKAIFGWMSDKMLERYLHSAAMERKTAVQHLDTFMANVQQQDSIQ